MRGWPAARVDMALATVLLVATALELAWVDAPVADRLAAFGVGCLVALALAARRHAPLGAGLLATGAVALLGLAGEDTVGQLVAVYVGWLMVTYAAGVRLPTLPLTLLAALEVLLVAGASLAPKDAVGGVLTGLVLFVLAPIVGGRMLRELNALATELAGHGALLEAERADAAGDAVAAERVRIAGELHDVVAHALGAMTIQAAVARRLADRDAARATGAFQAIEDTGRDALTELRTAIEVLRHGAGESKALEPQPGLGALRALVERYRAAGLRVGLEVRGELPDDLPRGVDLTAYRVVEEALTEGLGRGGAGSARVTVIPGPAGLAVEVSDDGPPGADRQLVGLQERVRVCGGELQADEPGGGGHVVRVRIPLEGTPA